MEVAQIMQIASIAGNVGKDAELKTTQAGDQVCRFSVAVSTGWGDRKATTWWDVSRWGKGADKLAGMIRKGAKVAVSGELSTREHEGKTYLQIRADHVTLQGDVVGATHHSEPRGGTRYSEQRAPDTKTTRRDDLDDDVPF